MEKLPGDYIAGFIDGEGCFYLMYRSEIKRKRSKQVTYYRWLPYFAMTLREDDIAILKKIQNTLGCGNVYKLKKRIGEQQAYFGIQHIDDLYRKVMPFFQKYQLRAKKRFDFELWCKALTILYRNKSNRARCSEEDHKALSAIREQMRQYKSKRLNPYKNYPMGLKPKGN